MSKPTAGDKLRFIAIMQNLMNNHEARGGLQNESDSVKALFAKAYQRYNKQADAILQPQPRKPRNPKTEHVMSDTVDMRPIEYTENKIERWGRDGRK